VFGLRARFRIESPPGESSAWRLDRRVEAMYLYARRWRRSVVVEIFEKLLVGIRFIERLGEKKEARQNQS
jgi:hypothetical protein